MSRRTCSSPASSASGRWCSSWCSSSSRCSGGDVHLAKTRRVRRSERQGGSAERMGEGEEEFAVPLAPDSLDYEAGLRELLLDPLGGELRADLREQVLALVEAHGDAGAGQGDDGGFLGPQPHLDPLLLFVPQGDVTKAVR